MTLLEDKQVDLIEGQTNKLPLLGDKHTSCPYWGTNKLTLLGDKQVDLIGGQTS